MKPLEITFPYAVLLFGLLFASCRSEPNEKMPLITKLGNYQLTPSPYCLRVENTNGLVHVSIVDSKGIVLVENDDASSYQKWLLFWDSNRRRLWLSSSDVGLIVWDLPVKGKPFEERVTPDKTRLLKEIPSEVFELQPESLKEKIKSLGWSPGRPSNGEDTSVQNSKLKNPP